MAGRGIFALFVLAYLVTLLVTAPASLLDRCLQYASQGRLFLANANGTVWNGTATPALRPQKDHFIVLQPLRWEIDALPLFAGKIKTRLQWSDLPPAPATDTTISLDRVELHNALLPLPARVLNEISPMLKPAQFRGQLQVQAGHLVFTKQGIDGTATVEWRQAGSALSGINPLGDYHLALSGAGGQINIGLTTTSGILLLNGQGVWSAAHGLEFHGKAQASSGNYDNLTELLHHLGPEESQGVHGFNITPATMKHPD